MQSSRLKNIIILILALVNLFLLASLFSRFSARRESREQTTTQLTELFAANGMTLSPDAVSFQPPPTGGTLARDTAQDRQMASLLTDCLTPTRAAASGLMTAPTAQRSSAPAAASTPLSMSARIRRRRPSAVPSAASSTTRS